GGGGGGGGGTESPPDPSPEPRRETSNGSITWEACLPQPARAVSSAIEVRISIAAATRGFIVGVSSWSRVSEGAMLRDAGVPVPNNARHPSRPPPTQPPAPPGRPPARNPPAEPLNPSGVEASPTGGSHSPPSTRA